MKFAYLAPLALALAGVAACSGKTGTATEEGGVIDSSLAQLVANSPETSALASAIERTGMSGIFEGAGGYTVLTPANEAFDPIAAGSSDESDKAIAAAILRDHILPGQLELASISEAIDENDGKVSVSTMGTSTVEFTKDGETIMATVSGSDRSVKLTGKELQATNGALIGIDELLVLPPSF